MRQGVKGALEGHDGLTLALIVVVNHLAGVIPGADDAGAPCF
jgi:hypothetical protein